jgi:hypothetical protein
VTKPKRQKSAGRRTVLSKELLEKICSFIRAGTYDYVAAEACGVSRRTFFNWLERGEGRSERRQSPLHVHFVRAVRQAQAECRAAAEVTVKKIDPKWWLARMHRDRSGEPGWSDAQHVQLTGDRSGPLSIIQVRDAILAATEEEEGGSTA